MKIHAAFAAAAAHTGQPTVVLAKTMKGYAMGDAAQGRMTTHQAKKIDSAGLLAFRDRFALPMNDADTPIAGVLQAAGGSAELKYLHSRRQALGGYLPARRTDCPALAVPPLDTTAAFALQADGKEMSTTMAFVRMLGNLLKDPALGPRIVPIVADEARTFGMASLFRQVGIYAPFGQLYQPEDSGSVLYYREDTRRADPRGGHHRGRRAVVVDRGGDGVFDARPADAAVLHLLLMFGFQRVGDLIWAAADQRARGFLIGATAGRTTLGGEGLQHQDGSSHLVAATVPNCKAYDPATAGELAVIVDRGMREMLEEQRDVFYYVTAMNENVAQPSLPAEAHEGVLRGLYRFRAARRRIRARDGRERRTAAVACCSARARSSARSSRRPTCSRASTASRPMSGASPASASWRATASPPKRRWRRGERDAVDAYLTAQLAPTEGPIVVATDYVRAVPEQIRAFLPPAGGW